MICTLILMFFMQVSQNCGKPVAKDFSYPPSMTAEIGREVTAQTLSGRVTYGEDQKLPDALVEIIDHDKQRVQALLTDSEGRFCFAGLRDRLYHLRISMRDFDTLTVPFRVSQKAKRKAVVIQLHISD